MKIHILGISGTFMTGIAILAKQKGHQVTGSDFKCYDPMKSVLDKAKIKVSNGYNIRSIKNKDLIIVGNVMSRGSPVIEYILKNKLNYISGPQWLYENILKYKKVIAVSGTHGKTTTTSMITHILKNNKFRASYLIGGNPIGLAKPANLVSSKYFIIEADEYDTAFFDKRSKFMHYNPEVLIINNLEFDHADIFNNLDDVIKTFHHLVRLVPSSGNIIVRDSDKNIQKLLSLGCWSKITKIGSNKLSNYKLHKKNRNYYFVKKDKTYKLPTSLIGDYNYANASMAIAVCDYLKIPINKQIKSLSAFKGVKRRMEYKCTVNNIDIYDDFAHHPTAIKGAIQAIKNNYKKRKCLQFVYLLQIQC